MKICGGEKSRVYTVYCIYIVLFLPREIILSLFYAFSDRKFIVVFLLLALTHPPQLEEDDLFVKYDKK